jgi:hypothetical protein
MLEAAAILQQFTSSIFSFPRPKLRVMCIMRFLHKLDGVKARRRDSRSPTTWLAFETTVQIKSTVFWVVTPCSLEIAQRLEGIYNLHLQCRRVTRTRNQQKQSPPPVLLVSCSGYFSTLKIETKCSS